MLKNDDYYFTKRQCLELKIMFEKSKLDPARDKEAIDKNIKILDDLMEWVEEKYENS